MMSKQLEVKSRPISRYLTSRASGECSCVIGTANSVVSSDGSSAH